MFPPVATAMPEIRPPTGGKPTACPFITTLGPGSAYAASIVCRIHLTGPRSRSTTTLPRDAPRPVPFPFARADAFRAFVDFFFVGIGSPVERKYENSERRFTRESGKRKSVRA